MRILWDLRLFSTAYSHRGVGVWTRRMITAMLSQGINGEIIIWGNREDLPAELGLHRYPIIPWKAGDWRSDLFIIPAICLRHRIDSIHHWVTLGPILTIGLGLPLFSRRITTVYDCAIDLWETPIALARRGTHFHRIQKFLTGLSSHALCISDATRTDLARIIPRLGNRASTVYMPIPAPLPALPQTAPGGSFFLALGGAPHKNLDRTLEAFAAFREGHPGWTLHVAGHVEEGELPAAIPPWLQRIDMADVEASIKNAAGLLMFSQYEGLGIPVIDALYCACPVAASDIPSMREIGGDAIAYANPNDPASMASAMAQLTEDPQERRNLSAAAGTAYHRSAQLSAMHILNVYSKN